MSGMNPSILFTLSGRLGRQPFAIAVIVVYFLGLASQSLLTKQVLDRAGLFPFIVLHASLLWVWYVIHANRLRDAGRNTGVAIGIAIVNALCLLFLLMIVSLFDAPAADAESDGNVLGTWIVLLFLLAILSGAPHLGWFDIILWVIFVIAMLPILLAVGFSLWVGTRPSVSAVPS